MGRFKYVNAESLDSFFSILREELRKREINLTEYQIDLIKSKLLDDCPDNCFSSEYTEAYEAYRIIVDYGDGRLSFYPHVANPFEIEYTISRYIINDTTLIRFFRFILRINLANSKENDVTLKICKKLCKLLSVSLFLDCETAKNQAKRMIVYGKKVIEIRRGSIRPIYGKSYNFNENSKHIDWFPFEGINEWEIFCVTAIKFKDSSNQTDSLSS